MPAIEKQKEGYSLRFRPFGKQIRVNVPVNSEDQVYKIKDIVERACKFGDFSRLDRVPAGWCRRPLL